MQKTFTFEQLKESSQAWAIEQLNEKHPVQTREKTLDELTLLYEYNRFGDILDYSAPESDEQYEGLDPDYREDDNWLTSDDYRENV